MDRQLVKSG